MQIGLHVLQKKTQLTIEIIELFIVARANNVQYMASYKKTRNLKNNILSNVGISGWIFTNKELKDEELSTQY